MISDEQLRFFNEQGLIPGPDESEETFAKRADYCLHLHEGLSSRLGQDIPFRPEERADLSFFSEATEETRQRFGISPAWLPIFFSNYQLYPWHGGCAWIFQLTKDAPTAALLQLRKSLHHAKKLLGFYDRDELIAHELAHVGRMAFEEPRFEEVIAYSTARSSFRRYFGPIVQSSFESFIFMILLIGIVVLDAVLLLRYPFAYGQAMWLKAIPLLLIALALGRLWNKQRTYKNCYRRLQNIFQDKASPVLYRLTDKEIAQFAASNEEQIKEYMRSQSSLRWRIINVFFAA